MSKDHLRRVLVEDIPSLVACHTVATQSADLAPVHSARVKQPQGHAMDKRGASEGASTGVEGRVSGEAPAGSPELDTELRDKLSFKNGVVNGIKLGTTDAEVHVPARAKGSEALKGPLDEAPRCKGEEGPGAPRPRDEVCSESSHDASRDVNGSVCNGHGVSEATSTSSINISDTFSINSEKSSDSCGSGARPRTRGPNAAPRDPDLSSSRDQDMSTTRSDQDMSTTRSDQDMSSTRSEQDMSSTSDSLVTPEICISPVLPSEEVLKIDYVNYENELQMSAIMRLIQKDLSEPYSIYTYRYFIHNWPKLCFLAMASGEVVGAIVCKLDVHKKVTVRGYIAMLAVDHRYRKRKIGSNLVQRAIRAMASDDADEVVLETEITNKPALRLYENLGFVRDKRLFRYYLNGVDALRLKLWLR